MQKIFYKDKLRDVVVINKPSDNYFMLDLSEYTREDKEHYEYEFNRIHREYLDKLKELGVNSNYRYFKEDKITWVIEDETEKPGSKTR